MDEYRSPIRLVLHTGESAEPYNAQSISRARKKLLAELSLSGDELVIDDISYSRNDIVTLLDATTSEATWPAHNFIHANKLLLRFLEKNEFTPFFTENIERPEPGQAEFISRYFAHSFDIASRQQLRAQDFYSLSHFLSSQDFIDPADSHAAYYSIRVYFDDINHLLRNLNWEKYERDKNVLDFLYIKNFSGFVNALPPSFNSVRDNFVLQVILLVERLQHKERWSALRNICRQLQDIECSPHLKQEVDKFERIMAKNAQSTRFSISSPRKSVSEGSGSSSGRGAWTIIWIVIVIGRFIMVGNSCNSSRSSDSFDLSTMRSLTNMWHQAEMNSRNPDEINMKKLLGDLAGKTNTGITLKPDNKEVFSAISHPPDSSGMGRVIIVNNTSKDMIALGFMNWQMVSSDSVSAPKFLAIRIPHKGSAIFDIQSGFTRMNILMGNGWVKLRKPLFIDSVYGKKPRYLREFFRTTPEDQEYMKGELLFSSEEINIEDPGEGSYSSMVYRPITYTTDDSVKVARLQFDEEKNRITPTIQGNYFIYRKKDRAYYRELEVNSRYNYSP